MNQARPAESQDSRQQQQKATPERGQNHDPFSSPFDDDNDNYDISDDDEEILRIVNKPDNLARLTQWPTASGSMGLPPIPSNAPKNRKSRRHSIGKSPMRKKSRARQREQNAKAGLKVNTNFSRHRGAPAVAVSDQGQMRPPQPTPVGTRFIDLAALQALERPKPTGPQVGFWNSLFGGGAPQPAAAAATKQTQESNPAGLSRGLGSRRTQEQPMLDLQNDLSPCDRPIMIGMAIPSATINQHEFSPDAIIPQQHPAQAGYSSYTHNLQPPGTPEIMITPAAAEVSYWSPDTASATTPEKRRITSSIHSRPANSSVHASPPKASAADAPPMPQIPRALRNVKQLRDSVDTIFDEDDAPPILTKKKPRITSTATVFEEDESPILTRKTRSSSILGGNRLKVQTNLSPNGSRTSFGWWNTIVSPFMKTPNPGAAPDATTEERTLPLQIPTHFMTEANQSNNNNHMWEKALSPVTATTIGSDAWCSNGNTLDNKHDWAESNAREKDGVHTHRTQPSVSTQGGTLPFMLGNTLHNELGLAAEAEADRQRGQAALEASSLLPESPLVSRQRTQSVASQSFNPYSTTVPTTRQPSPPRGALNLQLATMSSQEPEIPMVRAFDATSQAHSVAPSTAPPPYSAAPQPLRARAIFPPSHLSPAQHQQVQSPGLVSPGLQAAMTSTGAIPMDEVPLTPAPLTVSRVINLNCGYPTALPSRTGNSYVNPVDLETDAQRARKIEAKRRGHEKEDAVGHRAGGLWRGRGCFPKRGCYGRGGAEGRRRRRCWLGGVLAFIIVLIVVIVLVTQLRPEPKKDGEQVPSQWVNLTAFPPMFTGVSTVVAPENVVENTGCVYPKTVWSCSLPKELHASVEPNQPNQPNLRLLVQWDNSSAANQTFGLPTKRSVGVETAGNTVTAGSLIKRLLLQARKTLTFSPSPEPPNVKEIAFLANTTDGVVSDNKSGEATPFYMSLLDPTSSLDLSLSDFKSESVANTGQPLTGEQGLSRRQSPTASPSNSSKASFDDLKSTIPPPAKAEDSTAAPANLFPTSLSQQPLRLFDRGLPTENYAFYTYYTRSIFLKSTALLNSTDLAEQNGEVPDDLAGGSTKGSARVRCSWAETRYVVRIWTNRGTSARMVGGSFDVDTHNSTEIGTFEEQPGSFPYPVTIKVDRHGGNPKTKGAFCYELDVRGRPIAGSGKVRPEFRGFGGTLINQAPSSFKDDSDASLGGFDGGNSGCSCEWRNFQASV